MGQISDIGADADDDAEMTILCGISFFVGFNSRTH